MICQEIGGDCEFYHSVYVHLVHWHNMKLELPPTSWPMFCLLRNTGHRLIGIKSHIDYLTRCKELNIITKGLYHHSKVNVGDRKFEGKAQEKMNLISRELQADTINWYKNKYKDFQKEFHQVKAEFFRSTDQYKVQYAYEELRKEMNRIRHSYDEEKKKENREFIIGQSEQK